MNPLNLSTIGPTYKLWNIQGHSANLLARRLSAKSTSMEKLIVNFSLYENSMLVGPVELHAVTVQKL